MSALAYKRKGAAQGPTARQRTANRDQQIIAIIACVLAFVLARLHAPDWLPLLLVGLGLGTALRLAITAESEHSDA